MRPTLRFLVVAALLAAALPARAQSPDTSTLVVVVEDPQGAVVPEAAVALANPTTGVSRTAAADTRGAATLTALPLTGLYQVTVSKAGFADATTTGIALRAGETAMIRVKLTVAGGQSEVTVNGTTEGVRADPQLGLRLDHVAIDETPLLGRKSTTLPLLNSAFRQGKGTGDLFVNATYFITGVGSRRATSFTLDGANNDEGWGRQTAIATVPLGAIKEIQVLTNAGALDRGKQLAVVERLTAIAADAAGDPGLATRTWVLLTEAPDGGWGLAGHANTNEELVAAARAQLASLAAGQPADG